MNMFVQPGLGQILSRREEDTLRRQQIQGQIEAQKAQAARYSDPRYLQGQKPAAIQVSEYYRNLPEDQQRLFRESRGSAIADDLAKKGLQYDPTTQQVSRIPQFGTELGLRDREQITAQTPAEVDKARLMERAKQQEQLEYEPQRKAAAATAADRAQKRIELGERASIMPELTQTLSDLDKLSKTATYTLAGQAKDAARTQMGIGASEGAVARTEYDTKISNVVLPMLRQTFGAAFTAAEGDSLRATLGDINATPKQKQAAIRSFMQQAKNNINSRERELGIPMTNWKAGKLPSQEVLDTFGGQDVAETTGIVQPNPVEPNQPIKGKVVDGYLFLGGNPADENSWRKVK